MSNRKTKCNSLPKLQHRIIMCLAENTPMNIRETNGKLKGEYTSTNRAFKELVKKGCIKKVDVKEYRGNRYSMFWLTDKGLIYAIIHGANPNVLLRLVETVYPNEPEKAILVKLSNLLEPNILHCISKLLNGYGLTSETVSASLNASLIYTTYLTHKNPQALIKKILATLKEYPEFYNSFKQTFRGIKKGMLDLDKLVEGVEAS